MSLPRQKSEGYAHGRKSIEFTERDLREAARLLSLISNAESPGVDHLLTPPQSNTMEALDRGVLLARVRKHFFNRQLRTRYFNRAIFGEPAWEMLLVLYVTEQGGGRQTVRRLADWVNTPTTTALRWIQYLAKEHLIRKEPHPTDRRMAYITLLDKGRALLEDYFSSIDQ